MSNKKSDKKLRPGFVFGLVVIIVCLIISTICVVNFVVFKPQSTATQVENHIGYFDEDPTSSSYPDIFEDDNGEDSVAKVPKSYKDNMSEQSVINHRVKTNEKLLQASLNRKNNKSTDKAKKQVKVEQKLTKAQKEVKKHSELNNGEWLPPVKD